MADRHNIAMINIGLLFLMAITFAADLTMPHGVAGWILYLPACLISAVGGRMRRTLLVASACSILLLVGYFVSPPPNDSTWEIANRSVALIAIWSTLMVARAFSRGSDNLADTSLRLTEVFAERSRAIASLNRSEHHLAAVINTATDGIITIDATQTIVMINPAAEQLFGYGEGELTGARLERLMPLRFRSVHSDHLAEFAGTGKSARRMGGKVDVFGVRANGEEFPVDASISNFIEGGQQFFTVILRDISKEKHDQAELTRSQRELRELSMNLLGAREEERKHISRELHDDLGQRLAALRNDITLLRRGIGSIADTSAFGGKLARDAEGIDALLVDTIASLRRISADLRPRPLDDLGLVSAIRLLAADFSKHHGLRCMIEAHDLEPVLESRTSVALYRMVQESLNNAAKHAGASKVSIKLEWHDEVLVVEIADDGIGMGEAEMRKPGSFGLIGMRERANALGGSLIVNSAPGAGTRLQFSVPAPQTPASAGSAADQPA